MPPVTMDRPQPTVRQSPRIRRRRRRRRITAALTAAVPVSSPRGVDGGDVAALKCGGNRSIARLAGEAGEPGICADDLVAHQSCCGRWPQSGGSHRMVVTDPEGNAGGPLEAGCAEPERHGSPEPSMWPQTCRCSRPRLASTGRASGPCDDTRNAPKRSARAARRRNLAGRERVRLPRRAGHHVAEWPRTAAVAAVGRGQRRGSARVGEGRLLHH